ncbi:hypothetical protein PMIT1306_02156 [Prochlorococcus sp. MIT 1306]|nr:hypothetical protein PMIT1306_02156 [Prochlorococcus sp. MIT 1306]
MCGWSKAKPLDFLAKKNFPLNLICCKQGMPESNEHGMIHIYQSQRLSFYFIVYFLLHRVSYHRLWLITDDILDAIEG